MQVPFYQVVTGESLSETKEELLGDGSTIGVRHQPRWVYFKGETLFQGEVPLFQYISR